MKTKIKMLMALLLIYGGCKKEQVGDTTPLETQFSLSEAQAYINGLPRDSVVKLSRIKIDWTNAQQVETDSLSYWRIILPGRPIYQEYQQGHRELVIGRNLKSGETQSRILEVIPDAIYLQTHMKSDAATFTGRIYEYNLRYLLQGGSIYSGGKPIGNIKKDSMVLSAQQKNFQTAKNLSGVQGKLMMAQISESCMWYQDSYVNADGELVIHSQEICTYTIYNDAMTFSAIGATGSMDASAGSGGSASTSDPVPEVSNLPGEYSPKVDPKKMMECFSNITSPNAAFVVRVLVVEPLPGTSFNIGSNSFGHVAISLSKTSGSTTITQTIGFYPTGSGLEKLNSKSQMLDNGDMEYNIGATWYVNGENFQKLIDFISNPPENYHFTDYNCSAFVYQAGQASGVPIPNPTTQIGLSGPGGAGYAMTPAGMAGALKAQKAANPGADINEGGGRAPASNGPCNKQ